MVGPPNTTADPRFCGSFLPGFRTLFYLRWKVNEYYWMSRRETMRDVVTIRGSWSVNRSTEVNGKDCRLIDIHNLLAT